MSDLDAEVVVVGSGAGGALTAALLAEAGRSVSVLEEGPRVDPGAVEAFSLDEMVQKYRHRGTSATLGAPPIAFAEGRCVGGSTEINSGLWHRLPDDLAEEWRRTYAIDAFTPTDLAHHAAEVEKWQSVGPLPHAPPTSSAVLVEGADALGWRSVEFPRVFRYEDGRAEKQTMSRTMIPRAEAAGARVHAGCRVERIAIVGDRATGLHIRRGRPDGTEESVRVAAEQVFVCAGAIHTPALLQRSRVRVGAGRGLKVHPTVKIAARFPRPIDHGDVPMHRVVEFSPHLTIGGSASRRGHVALAVSDSGADVAEAMEGWENVGVYYAAIRGEASGRVLSVPGLRAPVVTYRLTEGDMSRLVRGLVHLGEVLFAAGATALYPSAVGAPVAHTTADLVRWWDTVTRASANLMTVHLTSTVRMGEAGSVGADSFGRVRGLVNVSVNDASLLPDAPGVNPQAAIMTIAARNCAHHLAQ